MNRRGFFQRTAGALVAAIHPSLLGDAYTATFRHSGSVHVIPKRMLMARIQITGPMMTCAAPGAFTKAAWAEMAGLMDDLDPPRGQHCIWGSLKRGGAFVDYVRWEASRP